MVYAPRRISGGEAEANGAALEVGTERREHAADGGDVRGGGGGEVLGVVEVDEVQAAD